ncbi:hypothetical protein LguiB_001821 [Lonicera macranthoides]
MKTEPPNKRETTRIKVPCSLFGPRIRSEESGPFGGKSPFLDFKKALRLTPESLLPLESGNLFFQQSSPL